MFSKKDPQCHKTTLLPIPNRATAFSPTPKPIARCSRSMMNCRRAFRFRSSGFGASAGGLEAISEFLSALRVDSGMAYVFVQHLPPTGETMLAEILSKRTPLPSVLVEQGMAVESNHLYIIRPGRTLAIQNGVFRLGEHVTRPMNNRPIDDFFKSLAEEQREARHRHHPVGHGKQWHRRRPGD